MSSSKTAIFLISIIFCLCSFSYATCRSTSDDGCKQSPKFVSSVQSTIQASSQAISVIIKQLPTSDFDLSNAIYDCVELLDDSIDHLRSSISDPTGVQCSRGSSPCTSISGALANQEICMEGLHLATSSNTSFVVKKRVIKAVNPLTPMMTHLLTMVNAHPTRPASYNNVDPPSWISSNNNINIEEEEANTTVALDGSGDYCSIMDAVNDAPKNSRQRFVIRIKKGVYEEHVNIPKNKPNLVMIGEGQDVTIITGNRSYSNGYKTFHTATFVVGGCGFMASHITFQNTAGPEGGQAVAMRSNAENLVFYRCTFSGYQDTLYARSGRQFFRECEIKGTVDFIFGDATAVFQLCIISVRKPMASQSNTITAQGRAVACSDSGYSFHECAFIEAEELEEETRTYLGRPWRNHSRTVVMKSFLGELIDSEGWMDWGGRSALDTIYYGEYMNIGPGSYVADRVKWPGFHVIVNESEAMNFTVGRFINGDQWLPSTGVVYVSGLDDF